MHIEVQNLAVCKACGTYHQLKQVGGDAAAEIANCAKCGASYTQFTEVADTNIDPVGSILDASFVF